MMTRMANGRIIKAVSGLNSRHFGHSFALLLTTMLLAPQLLAAALPAGRVVGWGGGAFVTDENRNPFPNTSNIVAVAAGSQLYAYESYVIALFPDGTIRGSGVAAAAKIPPELTNVIAISASTYAAFALRRDGSVIAWGSTNAHGVLLTTLPPDLTNVVKIVAAYDAALALRNDGTIVSWGERVATNTPPGLSNVSKLWTDGIRAIALFSNGLAGTWSMSSPFTNFPAMFSNIVDIAGVYGNSTAYLLTSAGTVLKSGDDPFFPSNLTNIVRLFTGTSDMGAAAITRGGKVIFWPDHGTPVSPPAGLSNVVSIVLHSPYYFVALTIAPQITAIEQTNQQATIHFPTFSGQQYTVESSPNLSPGSWANLATIPGTGYEATVTDTNAAGSARFYRLRQP